MTYKEAHKKLAKMLDDLSKTSQELRPSVAKELEQAAQHIHTAYIRLDEILYPRDSKSGALSMWDWRVGKQVTVEITGEPILVDDYDGEDMWFEVDIRFESGDRYYSIYVEEALRWESGYN